MIDLGDIRVRAALILGLCVLVAVGVLLVSGGGGDDAPTEEDEIAETVRDFVVAGNERDFVVVCDLLSDEARGEIERVASAIALSGDDACAKLLQARAGETVGDQTVEVLDVRIVANRAAADIATSDPEEGRKERTLELVRDTAGEWKVSSFGS